MLYYLWHELLLLLPDHFSMETFELVLQVLEVHAGNDLGLADLTDFTDLTDLLSLLLFLAFALEQGLTPAAARTATSTYSRATSLSISIRNKHIKTATAN